MKGVHINMKVVATTGYGMTGSTAITDLLSEYDGVFTSDYSAYEIRFLFDQNGILDLYDKLVKGNSPEAKETAIKSFKSLCERLANSGTKMNYEKYFNGHFMQCVNAYISDLGGDDYYTVHDFSKMTRVQRILYKILNKIYYIFANLTTKQGYSESKIQPITIFTKIEKHYLFEVSEDAFFAKTRKFINELFGFVSEKNILNVHRLVPMERIDDCTQFFDDISVISSERDPRDIFLNARYKRRDLDYPCQDVHLYCKYYRWIRTFKPHDSKSRVLHLQFEDLVYKYDDTVKQIEDFLGLESHLHVKAKTKFIPELARNNCNLMNEYPNEQENIKIIEQELPEFLYDFSMID